MTITAIDFGRLYRDHMAAASRVQKSADTWDTRAAEMSNHLRESSYANEFIASMNLSGATTLLDVGCGPGTICLPLANQLAHVYGLDFSRAMLDALMTNAVARGLTNVEAVHLAW